MRYNSRYTKRETPMKISTQFDAGAITVVEAENFENIHLRFASDNASEFKQWFYFRLQGAAYELVLLNIEDAGESLTQKAGQTTKRWLLAIA